MKYLSPQQAMLGMRVVLTDNGMIIKSPAGSAEYNLKGRRIKVTGYPEYFPGLLAVKDKRTKKHGRGDISGGELTVYGEGGTVRVRMGRINPSEEQKLVEFKAEKFEVKRSSIVYLKDAVISAGEMKTRLSDDMREAVVDAVRESDLFKSLQASALVTTQQAIEQAATNAIRNAVKPGGLLHRARGY